MQTASCNQQRYLMIPNHEAFSIYRCRKNMFSAHKQQPHLDDTKPWGIDAHARFLLHLQGCRLIRSTWTEEIEGICMEICMKKIIQLKQRLVKAIQPDVQIPNQKRSEKKIKMNTQVNHALSLPSQNPSIQSMEWTRRACRGTRHPRDG